MEQSLDNRIYQSNHQNDDFGSLPFDGDERLISRLQLYHINYIIVFSYLNGLSVCIKTNQMES